MSGTERGPAGDFRPMDGDGVIVCRCEEVTRGEIRKAVADGIYTMTEMRRWLRCCMGLCQGQTCSRNVRTILARERGIAPVELEVCKARTPVRPLEMSIWASSRTGS